MNKNPEVTTTQIDQLRAGLLDRNTALGSRVHSALDQDDHLSQQDELWARVCEQLDTCRDDDPKLTNQLRIRRRSILSGRAPGKPRRFTLPQMALAAAASVALTLSVVLWFGGQSRTGAQSIAHSELVASTNTNNPDSSTGANINIDMDLANNVDFYVWIDDRHGLFIE